MDDPKKNVTVEDLVKETVKTELAEVQHKYGELFKAAPAVVKGAEEVEKSITAARYIKLAAVHNGDIDKMGKAAEKAYARDELLNSEIKAASVTDPSAGGFLVPEVLASELIGLLYNKLSVYQAGARRIPMPNGNLLIPRMDTGATVGYIGENGRLGKTQQVFGDIKLSSKKLGAVIPMSNDLLRSSSMAADTYIRDDLVKQMYLKMDLKTLYGLGTDNEPHGLASLLNSSNIVGSSTTAFTADIPSTLIGVLYQANVPMTNPYWIINGVTYSYLLNLKTSTGAYIFADEMLTAKTLRGFPYIVSNQVSYTAGSPGYVDIFLGDFSEFIIGEQMGMQIETSREASYYDGSNTISAFQNDQTLIRAISLHDFAIRHDVSFVQGTYKLATS